jgi:GntR family transcriptional regulator/MocR family aminotransferase
LIAALETWLPDLTIEGIAAGVHLLLRLPDGVDDGAVAEAARRARISVSPLSTFHLTPAAAVSGLVIGYGTLQESAIEEATRALAEVIRSQI